jgi:hypothetical protein
MTERPTIVPPGDFDLAAIDSGGGWWIGAHRLPDQLFGGFVGEDSWQERLSQWAEFTADDPASEPVLTHFDARAAALSEAALSFRFHIRQRLQRNQPYPDANLPLVSLVSSVVRFLEHCRREEFQQLRALIPDPAATGGLQAYARDSVLLVVPSNVVVAGLDAIQQALLVGCRRVLVRLPRAGASVIVDYCRTLALTDPGLGERLILMRWPATDQWPSVLRNYPAVAFGGDDSLRAIREQSTSGSLGVHGHQVGVALTVGIPRPVEVRGLASSTLIHEQRGCLSPRLVLAAGVDREALITLARDLAAALDPAPSPDGDGQGLPMGTTLSEQATVARRRDELRLTLATGAAVAEEMKWQPEDPCFGLEVSPGGQGSVEWHWAPPSGLDKRDLDLITEGLESAQGRHLVLVGLSHDQPPATSAPYPQPEGQARAVGRELLGILNGQPISILGCTDAAQALARRLAALWPTLTPANRPIPRISSVHSMQYPTLTNPLDARPPLWDFLHFVQDTLD